MLLVCLARLGKVLKVFQVGLHSSIFQILAICDAALQNDDNHGSSGVTTHQRLISIRIVLVTLLALICAVSWRWIKAELRAFQSVSVMTGVH